jgi:hypothetical protein
VKQLGNSYYAMIAHQMKLKPAKADASVKLRRCLTTPPLAVGLVTANGAAQNAQLLLTTT